MPENGKENMAELLKERRDMDLRRWGVEAGNISDSGSGLVAYNKTSCVGPLGSLEQNKLHMKQSNSKASFFKCINF